MSDRNIENYTVAPDRELSVKHEQTTCVPVTFINDSKINFIKTGANKDGNYFPTETFKRLDLTPDKQGYSPERHPTKKQKVRKEIPCLKLIMQIHVTLHVPGNMKGLELKQKENL